MSDDPSSLINRLESLARWDASEHARDLPGFTVEMSAAWQAAEILKMLREMTHQPKPKDFTFWAIKPGHRTKFCEMMTLFEGPAESFLPAFLRYPTVTDKLFETKEKENDEEATRNLIRKN